MPLDLLKLPADEGERIAYAEGFPRIADLLGRIADLQAALGRATAEIAYLKDQRDQFEGELWVARHERAYPEGLD